MVMLQIRIRDEQDGQIVEVDRLLREDATEKECATIDVIHDLLKRSFERSPSRSGPIVEIKKTGGA